MANSAEIFLEHESWGRNLAWSAALHVGITAAILLFIKKYRKPKPMAEVGPVEIDDPELAKYKDQIEKDLANLDS